VQFAEVVLAQAQWAKQSVAIQSLAHMFHIFAQTDTKFVPHLQ
jgi:hypothetical protein